MVVGWAGLSARGCFGCQELDGGGTGEEFVDKNQGEGVTLPKGI